MDFPLPHQLILFGPPGTSKSYLARTDKAERVDAKGNNVVPVTFHPDYSYGEFVARLLPLSDEGSISYTMYAGPFIRALSSAYSYWANHANGQTVANVVLLIDEINRGNCAEIFGDVFQLLDRADDGWSSYEISVSDLIIKALDTELKKGPVTRQHLPQELQTLLDARRLKLPPNLFLIATMNTSDESVFFMDSAFKRRWNFKFCPANFDNVPSDQATATVTASPVRNWKMVLNALNAFILAECPSRNMDDKLIGPWFIKAKAEPTLGVKYKENMALLNKLSKGVTVANSGRDNSDAFDKALVDFVKTLPPLVQERIFAFAQYDESAAHNKLRAIEYDQTSSYYLSKRHKRGNDRVIEVFLEHLCNLNSGITTHKILNADIHGKLFLYLWDSVFERDKSPLAKKLGVPTADLRTFGQFVDHADLFIERLFDTPPTSPVVGTHTTERA
ncbi:AAA family ATPase [Pseudomonas fluorescens]|nr:AAA family ATPase [Pseudomonas fluorescens]